MNLVQTPPWHVVSPEPEPGDQTRSDDHLWSNQTGLVVSNTNGRFTCLTRNIR